MKYSIDLISDMVPPLKTTDSGGKALTLMEVFKVSHLPVVDQHRFVGLISENDILDLNDPDITIGSYKPEMAGASVLGDIPIFDVLSQAAEYGYSVLAVVDSDYHYLGSIPISELLVRFVESTSLHMPGAFIVLDVNIKDYSLAHISQVVESNDAKIIGSFVMPKAESSQLEVVIKVNTVDLTSILQTFYRYSYVVSNVYNANDQMEDVLDDRYDQLMKYLDI